MGAVAIALLCLQTDRLRFYYGIKELYSSYPNPLNPKNRIAIAKLNA